MFKQSFALESTSHAAQWSHTFSCFLLLDLFVWKKKNVRAFEIGERFNPQKTHTQTHGQGSGRRSNGSELSPFGPRTSEVPLCAALHLFYPSSLIRPGWPCDPGARVTCQLTVYSWALGLMLCQHLLCKGEERNLVQCGGKKTKATKKKQKLEKVRKTAFILFWNQLVKIYVAFVSTHPDSLHVKRMCDNSCWLRGAQQTDACMDTWWGVPTKTLQKPPPPTPCVCVLSVINQVAVSGILERRCYQRCPVYTHTTVSLICAEITDPPSQQEAWTRHTRFLHLSLSLSLQLAPSLSLFLQATSSQTEALRKEKEKKKNSQFAPVPV